MAKKTRTELSTLAINTNLPDNTQELITPTTERAQLTDERESVVNYKDDLGGTTNAGKFLTVATDGESLTMVDEPSGVPDWVTFITAVRNQMLLKAGGDGTGTSEAWLKFTSYDGSLSSQINFNGIDGSFYINGSQSQINLTSQISFIIGGTPRLTITSGGDVGIGITPTSKLTLLGTSTAASNTPSDAIVDIKGTSTAHLLMGVANVSPYGAWINTDSTTQPLILMGTGGNVGIGSTGVYTTNAILNLQGSGIALKNDKNGNNDNWSYIENTGTASLSNINFYTGNNASALNLSHSGLATFSNGIKFGGTPSPAYDVAATTLDAYEEGTWTPVINLANVSHTKQEGFYTRIGNVVHYWADVNFTDTSGGGQQIFNLSLPFTTSFSGFFGSPAIGNAYRINLGTGGTMLGGYYTGSQIRFHSSGNNTNQLSPFSTGGNMTIRMEGIYQI